MKTTIICDIDGTVADCTHRLHHVTGDKKDWDAFYAGVEDDSVIDAVALVVKTLIKNGHYCVIYCTGRPERCRRKTLEWLGRNDLWNEHYCFLLMRSDDDHRPDHVIKNELVDNLFNKDEILFVLEDRKRVVDMWRKNGFACMQVADGNF